ncbi:hypothetical protein GK047_19640 [Paenibacillus sp. SYP-B3998]|uniref:Uncharacterized protein n=1 Tax=Paenibacillus sp. SYP-B3998 TaxID=2678564 RepID=A0A6G4A3J0_9BACL|nr:hypothetical protein [Paenibacillus sp. SYP-B3998]NEW08217.1 hypothetical protein [Paenibacillus sp. SYP-B3998]
MKILLNEKELVGKALNDRYMSPKVTDTIRALTKFYYGEGLTKKQVKEALENFIIAKYQHYDPMKWDALLNRNVKQLEKSDHKLYVVDEIRISLDELKKIAAIDNLEYEKIAFALLVHTKIYNYIKPSNDDWMNSSQADVYGDSNLSIKAAERKLVIHELTSRGLIYNPVGIKNTKIKILYVNNQSDTEIIIKDLRNYVYEYLRWKGHKDIMNCLRCDLRILKTYKTNKYCAECSKKVKQEQKNNWKKEKWLQEEK